MEKTMNCQECKKEFSYIYNSKYKRKFCPKCSASRKKDWEENRHLLKYEDGED